jgi:hypothetical protein
MRARDVASLVAMFAVAVAVLCAGALLAGCGAPEVEARPATAFAGLYGFDLVDQRTYPDGSVSSTLITNGWSVLEAVTDDVLVVQTPCCAVPWRRTDTDGVFALLAATRCECTPGESINVADGQLAIELDTLPGEVPLLASYSGTFNVDSTRSTWGIVQYFASGQRAAPAPPLSR